MVFSINGYSGNNDVYSFVELIPDRGIGLFYGGKHNG
jgi:hypothetical protein